MFEGKMKAFTLSYDDGVKQDERFVELLNKYNLKCTFNLNSGIQSESNKWVTGNGLDVVRMNIDRLNKLYEGHEIAVHALTHPNLPELTRQEVEYEIKEDIKNLTEWFGVRPVGMAYPFGTYSDMVVDVLAENGIRYARTVEATHSFDVPTDLLRLPATCHHNDEALFELGEKFVNMKADTPQIFYLWGHTYEFDDNDNWDMIEDFFKLISGRDDIFYGTNKEVLL